ICINGTGEELRYVNETVKTSGFEAANEHDPSREVLRVSGLCKYFGGVAANEDISLTLHRGEILAIAGENGAGKSTFCKMLTGVYHPDKGEIFIDGEKVKFDSPADSIAAGIKMVYQERNLVGLMTGAQNICLAQEPCKMGMIDEKKIIEQAEKTKKKLGLTIDLSIPVEKVGAGEQQLIEILRAFQTEPKILILDEPTASLGQGEIEPFLNFIKRIKQETDIAIIFISHKFEEVYEIADKIAVFTDGRNVLCADTKDLSQDECIRAMLRSDKIAPLDVSLDDSRNGEPVLKVEKGFYDGKEHNIEFSIYPGEIVGFYGLVGSGRTECAEYLFGKRPAAQREFIFNGEKIQKGKPIDMISKGMIMTPEKRMNGLFRALSLTDNICNLFLTKMLKNRILGTIDAKKCQKFSLKVLKDNNVKYRSQSQPVVSLSGGNMQKIIIGRSVALENIKLLIVDEPTTGMDIGAKYQVYRKLLDLADKQSLSVMMISSELDELLAVCRRIYVFAGGNCIQEFARRDFDKRKIVETAVRGRRI
ncbi:MAG: sugar ABC transporter ATP-binding protein, partial [Bacillota bacterium]|nr:sugar ABC transporter ATP-binding protein [Bacillota bacterium]